MLTFKFIVAVHVWYEILFHVNNINKLWQSIQVNLKVAVDTLRSFCTWIQEFRDTGFEKSVADAQLFVEKSADKIESQLKEKRKARKNECSVMNTWMNLYNLLKRSTKLIFQHNDRHSHMSTLNVDSKRLMNILIVLFLFMISII